MAELYLTPEQAAQRMQLHPETIRRQIKAGKLRAIRRGRLFRIPESALGESSAPRTEPAAVQAQAILHDLQSRTARTRNAAIVALSQAAPGVRAIVEAAAAKASEAYYATPEGREELGDWIALGDSEGFEAEAV